MVRDVVERVTTDPGLWFRSMDTYPGGSKAILLNRAGMAIVGKTSSKDSWFIGWCPLPKIPEEIKEKMK